MAAQRPEGYDPADYLTAMSELKPLDEAKTKADLAEAFLQRLDIAFAAGDTSILHLLLHGDAALDDLDQLQILIDEARQVPGFEYKFRPDSDTGVALANVELGERSDHMRVGWDLGGSVEVEEVAGWNGPDGKIEFSNPATKKARLRLMVSEEAILNDVGEESVAWRISVIAIEGLQFR